MMLQTNIKQTLSAKCCGLQTTLLLGFSFIFEMDTVLTDYLLHAKPVKKRLWYLVCVLAYF